MRAIIKSLKQISIIIKQPHLQRRNFIKVLNEGFVRFKNLELQINFWNIDASQILEKNQQTTFVV